VSQAKLQPRPVTISAPAPWSIGRVALQDAIAAWQAVAGDEVRQGWRSRSWPFALPPHYDDYCRRRFIAWRQTRPSTLWTDLEPVFALAAVTLPSSEPGAIAETRAVVQSAFSRLRAGSPLDWDDAQTLFLQAWAALYGLE
jgi:hypothetical protein